MAAKRARQVLLLSSVLYNLSAGYQFYPNLSEQVMKLAGNYLYPILGSGTVASALNCSADAFRQYLPAGASITSAIPISANSTFQVPAKNVGYPTSPTGLDSLCALEVKVPSSNTSAFSFGLFLPAQWNDRFLAVGNGGFRGSINWLDMGPGSSYGFAVMSTDTGHTSAGSGSWAANNSEAVLDWSYRAIHGSTVVAKQLIEAYYGKAPDYSYFSGCSTGGRQGLRNLQLYPNDFDGIVAGAPAWWTTHLHSWIVQLGNYNLPNTSASFISPSLFPVISAEVLRQCDGADGVIDNIISTPKQCDFQIEKLLCPGDVTNQTSARCLTIPQLDTLYKIYGDYVDVNQTFVFPHLALGSELQWTSFMSSTTGEPQQLGVDYVRYFLGLGNSWKATDYDYSIVQLADRLDPGNATADDFDLTPFKNQGGKLLMYHGLADALIPPESSAYFYKQVLRKLAPRGVNLDDFFRFFFVPGMQHCSNTPINVKAPWYFAGANQPGVLGSSVHSVPGFQDSRHDVLLSMMAWVENGTAPDSIIATTWTNDTIRDKVYRQRPLCMYPKRAQYNGKDDVNKAESWECA